jgi:DNA invertase Pin-like site-specific DNA recombinase
MNKKVHPLLVQKLREFIDDEDEIERIIGTFKFFGYARLSREDDDKEKDVETESTSITRQKEGLEGYGVIPEFVDDGRSGSLSDDEDIDVYRKESKLIVELDFKKRPDFLRMLKEKEKGKGVFSSISWDRWGRSIIAQEITRIYARKNDCQVLALHDSNQPTIRYMYGIMNEGYIWNQRKKMSDSSETKFKHGLYNGRIRLYGYKWIKGYERYQTLIPSNDAETELIKRLFVMAESKDINEIRSELNLDFGFVKNNLLNVYHAGFIKHHKKDVYKRGIHEAIIDLDKFLAVQRRLGNSVVADLISKV